jgi:hypothetical protein
MKHAKKGKILWMSKMKHRCDVLMFLYENENDSKAVITEISAKVSPIIPRVLINLKAKNSRDLIIS